MRKSRRPIVIASRPSLLARAQAQAVGRALAALHPKVQVRFVWVESEGDQRAAEPLAPAGGKGLFVRAVEQALLRGEADLAIHSLKDMTTHLTPGLCIAAVPRRGDVRDCLIAREGASIQTLPREASVGTASPRRAAQLLRLRPDLRMGLIRGNVDTRVRKVLTDALYDATLLAVAGLQRSGLGEHAQHPIDPAELLPAASQGALALQCRADDHVTVSRCLPLNDADAATAVHAERALVDGLQGDCDSPIAALVEPVSPGAGVYRLRVRVLSPDGQQCLEADEQAPAKRLGKLVKQVLEDFHARGAGAILHAGHSPAETPAAETAPI